MPPVPPREDKKSYENHNQRLRVEYAKGQEYRNAALINDLIDITYAQRRREILSSGHTVGYNMFKSFPFLIDIQHVCISQHLYMHGF